MNMPATQINSLATSLASKLELSINGAELIETLKATAFKGQVTDSQMSALLIVANQYGLNPWTKEIYAFPDKNNGIVPIVGVDGWSRIINQHPQFDGVEFEQDDESCTCIIYRKDRSKAIRVTEFMSECKRNNAQPWQTHPKRMLRHKALIQCARLAFGFVGIYDEDEAERIVEKDVTPKSNGELQTNNVREIAQTYISASQIEALENLISQVGLTVDQVCSHKSIKIDSLDKLQAARYDGVVNYLSGFLPPVETEYENVNS